MVGLFDSVGRIEPQRTIDADDLIQQLRPLIDFADVLGQEAAKRAITIDAAGNHNIVRRWPSNDHGAAAWRLDRPQLPSSVDNPYVVHVLSDGEAVHQIAKGSGIQEG